MCGCVLASRGLNVARDGCVRVGKVNKVQTINQWAASESASTGLLTGATMELGEAQGSAGHELISTIAVICTNILSAGPPLRCGDKGPKTVSNPIPNLQ